ncbi:hypothetical protein JOE31_003561 [Arthrobacter sp. PvP023]|uniref:AAA family ATPase n=1 Tax=Micrococcaceae TaxID=1268 RepID=UPI001AE345AE|nr:AAA family ATPase [Arthrobacter sp. PvP023]MBP1137329.1 hypothetical protein [Arthrobacter sp. PvP023]
MTLGEIRAGMHEDPRGTTVIINGAEFLCSDAHEYSSLLAAKLSELIVSQPRGGVTVVLAGGDFDMTELLVTGVDGGHRIEFGSCDQVNAPQYLLGDLQDAVIPAGAAIYEGPFGSLSTFFSPRVGPDGRSVGDAFLELPIGIEGANFSTAWEQNLVVCGGSRYDRSRVIAAMAKDAQESGALIWVATSAPDSDLSADWRHHRGSMATGVVQAAELLRLVCDRVFPRIDACRALNTTDVRDVRIPANLASPLVIFVDDLDAMKKDSANRPELEEAAEAVETLIDFIAKTANQTNVTLVVGTAVTGLAEFDGFESLWNSAARLQLAPSGTDVTSDEAPLYFAAPGLPPIPLEAARVQ